MALAVEQVTLDVEGAEPMLAQLADVRLAQDLTAARHWLVGSAGIAERRVASVSFCLGGYVSFSRQPRCLREAGQFRS